MNILSKNAEKISAFADGELSRTHDEELVTILCGIENREIWQNYHHIGDTLRAPDRLLSLSEGFCERIFKQLSYEPTYVVKVNARTSLEKKFPFVFSTDRFSVCAIWSRRVLLPGMAVLTAAVLTIFAMPKFGNSRVMQSSSANASSKLESTLLFSTKNDAPTLSYAMSDEYFREHQRYSSSVYGIPQYARYASSVDEADK